VAWVDGGGRVGEVAVGGDDGGWLVDLRKRRSRRLRASSVSTCLGHGPPSSPGPP